MKKLSVLFAVAGLVLFAIKTNAQQVIATSGGYYQNENLSLSWTVGEPVIETFTGANVTLTQGFQQPWSFYLQQIINVPMGWSGISGYVDPMNKGVEGIFSPWENDLIILASMTGMYWPKTGVNTLVNWDYSTGYQIKALNDFELTLTGTKIADPTINIPQGWSLMPVLVACETPVVDLFAGFDDLTIVKQVAGVHLYWPAYNINTLGNLIPGKAYFLAASGDGQVTFPACSKSKYVAQPPVKLSNNTPWNDLTPTAASHAVAFPAEVLRNSGLLPGDVVGAFTSGGFCAGQVEVQQSGNSLALVTFGNDEITAAKEGYENGEMLQFKVYRPATGEEMALEVEFDPALPNTGNYSAHGLSAVKSVTLQALGISESKDFTFEVYPNPSQGIFNLHISKTLENPQIRITDLRGSVIQIIQPNSMQTGEPFAIDLTVAPKGVYLLKVADHEFWSFKKLVVQ